MTLSCGEVQHRRDVISTMCKEKKFYRHSRGRNRNTRLSKGEHGRGTMFLVVIEKGQEGEKKERLVYMGGFNIERTGGGGVLGMDLRGQAWGGFSSYRKGGACHRPENKVGGARNGICRGGGGIEQLQLRKARVEAIRAVGVLKTMSSTAKKGGWR